MQLKKRKKSGKISIVLDFGSLQEYMKTRELTLQTFKCPSCGAPVNFPASGNTTVCNYCHNTIRAKIFSKESNL